MDAPVLTDDGVVDVVGLSTKLGKEVATATVRDQQQMGGLSGETKIIDVSLVSGEKMALAFKKPMARGSAESRGKMGLAREAYFYKFLAPQLSGFNIPRCYYATGNMETGEMVLLMECLEGAVPSGTFFGSTNPNNWSIKDKLDVMCEGNPSAADMTAQAFSLFARLHGTYWRPAELLEKSWLNSTDYLRGEGEVKWKELQEQFQKAWTSCRAAISAEKATIQWDEHLVACLDASCAKIDWQAFQKELKRLPFCLMHGDAHPHNFLWVEQRTPNARLCLIDFELVGLGSGARELGQYVVSAVDPDVRRANEREWVKAYHAELLEVLRANGKGADADAYTLEDCWVEYVKGGADRWTWFLPQFVPIPPMAQYWHDQLAAFLHDHVPDPSAAPMPRV